MTTTNGPSTSTTTTSAESSALQLQALQELRALRDNIQSETALSTSRKDEGGLSVAFVDRFSSIEKLSLRLRGSYSSEEEELDPKMNDRIESEAHGRHGDSSLSAHFEASPQTESGSVERVADNYYTEVKHSDETSVEETDSLQRDPCRSNSSRETSSKHEQKSEDNGPYNRNQEAHKEKGTTTVSVKEVSDDDCVGFETTNSNYEAVKSDPELSEDCNLTRSTPNRLTSLLRPARLHPRLQEDHCQSTPPKLSSPLVAANRILCSRSRSSLSVNSGGTFESAAAGTTATSSGQCKFQLKLPGRKKNDLEGTIKVQMVQQDQTEADGCMEVQVLPPLKKKELNPFRYGQTVATEESEMSNKISKEGEDLVLQQPTAEFRRKGNSITVTVIEGNAGQSATEELQSVSIEVTEEPTPKRFSLKMKLRSPRLMRRPSSRSGQAQARIPVSEQLSKPARASDAANTGEDFNPESATSTTSGRFKMFPPISPRKKALNCCSKMNASLSSKTPPKSDGEPYRRFGFHRIVSKNNERSSFAEVECGRNKSKHSEDDRMENCLTTETLTEVSASLSTAHNEIFAEEKKDEIILSGKSFNDKADDLEEESMSKSDNDYQEDLGQSGSSQIMLSSYEYDSLDSEDMLVLSSHASLQDSYRYAEPAVGSPTSARTGLSEVLSSHLSSEESHQYTASAFGSPTSARTGLSEVLSSDYESCEEDGGKGIYDDIRQGVGELLSPKNAQHSPLALTRPGSKTSLHAEKVREIVPIFSFSNLLEQE